MIYLEYHYSYKCAFDIPVEIPTYVRMPYFLPCSEVIPTYNNIELTTVNHPNREGEPNQPVLIYPPTPRHNNSNDNPYL